MFSQTVPTNRDQKEKMYERGESTSESKLQKICPSADEDWDASSGVSAPQARRSRHIL